MASYHAIRPRSSNPDDSSKSSGQQADGSGTVGKGRKRKAPAHVSQNACTNCKKARAKCDGLEGQSCTRCISRGMGEQCIYELHVKTAKEELVRKIKELELANKASTRESREKSRWIRNIIEYFGPGNRGLAILEQLKAESSEAHQDLANRLSSPPLDLTEEFGSMNFRDSEDYDTMDTDDETGLRWTSVTADDATLRHLMALYFTWVHSTCMFFPETMFMDSFLNHNFTYCSHALVNAICALGCRYCVDQSAPETAIRRLGDRFTQRVSIDLKNERTMTPLSAVTYAILSLLELSSGQARNASIHLRLAMDIMRDVDRSHWSEEAFQITYSGIRSLSISWAALTYSTPPAPLSTHAALLGNIKTDYEDECWRDYKFPPDLGKSSMPSRGHETAKELAKLSLINLETLTIWCGSLGKVTAKMVLNQYQRYISWKEELSGNLTCMDEDALLPHVLQLHITYAVAVCQLFNPVIEYQGLALVTKNHVKDIVVNSAVAGLEIYQRYTQRFTNRYQSPLQAFCLVHLCDVLLRHHRPTASQAIQFCLENLGHALPGFPVVGPLQAMFCESVLACGYKLPENVEFVMGGRSWESYSREDKLGCSERLTYAQPVDIQVDTIDSSLPERFKAEWDRLIEKHGGYSDAQRRASMQNPSEHHKRLSNSAAVAERGSEARPMDITSLVNP